MSIAVLLEHAFDIAWVLVGLTAIATGLLLRWVLAPGTKKGLARDLVVLSLAIFLLFPFFSITDDIAYFDYYFSRGQAPDGILWVKGSRREKQSVLLTHLPAVTFLLAATGALSRTTVSETIALNIPVRIVTRRASATCLRAPPPRFSSRFTS